VITAENGRAAGKGVREKRLSTRCVKAITRSQVMVMDLPVMGRVVDRHMVRPNEAARCP
jgi:hypothetical protein